MLTLSIITNLAAPAINSVPAPAGWILSDLIIIIAYQVITFAGIILYFNYLASRRETTRQEMNKGRPEVCKKHLWTHSTYACPWCASEGRCMNEEEATYAMEKNQHQFDWENKCKVLIRGTQHDN